jgi:hypothetical protein
LNSSSDEEEEEQQPLVQPTKPVAEEVEKDVLNFNWMNGRQPYLPPPPAASKVAAKPLQPVKKLKEDSNASVKPTKPRVLKSNPLKLNAGTPTRRSYPLRLLLVPIKCAFPMLESSMLEHERPNNLKPSSRFSSFNLVWFARNQLQVIDQGALMLQESTVPERLTMLFITGEALWKTFPMKLARHNEWS